MREALQGLMQGRTTLLAAHRLSTIRAAGRIAVLDHGRIREIDTHENLLLRRGLYFDLYNEQIVEGRGAAV